MQNPTFIEAKTFTCNYIEKEDRLLLTINYQDITHRVDFWITRAFLLKIIPYLFEYTASAPSVNLLESKTVSPTDGTTFTLTYQEPLLLESIDFTKKEKVLEMVFKNITHNIFVRALFDEQSLPSFVSLCTKAAPRYDWGTPYL